MSVIINGTTGIQNPLGSAAAPASTNTTNTNTGVYYPTGTTLGLSTNGTNAMYIDASQNVGIGTTSPVNKLNVFASDATVRTESTSEDKGLLLVKSGVQGFALTVNGAAQRLDISTANAWPTISQVMSLTGVGNVGIGTTSPSAKLDLIGTQWFRGAVSTGALGILTADGTSGANGISIAASFVTGGYGPIKLFTNNTEAARIDSSGNLLVGVTSSVNGGSAFTSAGTVMSAITAATTNTNMIVFRNGNGNVGSITTNGSATAFNTSSDYRLKHDVQPMQNALTTIAALKPVTYKWNADNSEGEGFIAHELQAVISHAVTGEKDAVNEDGSIKAQGVDYSKIVVHLVAAIQELTAEVTALKAKVGA